MVAGGFVFTETALEGVYIIEPRLYGDRRGYFMETYRRSDFAAAGLDYDFVQDNQSGSVKGVLRGLHFQRTRQQAKLVRAVSGEVFDVAVDLRRGSAGYGKWTAAVLSESNRRQLLIPRGFAHGFLVLSDYAQVAYKCDDYYCPGDEGGIIWNDPDIAIDWPAAGEILLSEKDKGYPVLAAAGAEL